MNRAVLIALVPSLLCTAPFGRVVAQATAPSRGSAASTLTPPNPHASELIGTVRQMYDGTLSPTLAVQTFRNIDRLFATHLVTRSSQPRPLPVTATPIAQLDISSNGQRLTLEQYCERNRVAGLLVLYRGRMVLERYAYGNTRQTRWMSMSIAKSITATLIGMAVKHGAIRSLDDPVVRYVKELQGSAYEQVTIRQLLTMTSGVRWNEAYTDPRSDRRRLLDAQLAQRRGAALEVMRALPRRAPPGSVWNYSTGETQIAAAVLKGATGQPLAKLLERDIWHPAGMEADATWWLDAPDGLEIGGSGLSATLRDYARFGLFVLREAQQQSGGALPSGWMRAATAPNRLTDGSVAPYGYMWWPDTPPRSAGGRWSFSAIGIFGQMIHIDPDADLVIVQWGAQTSPTGGAVDSPDRLVDAVMRATQRD